MAQSVKLKDGSYIDAGGVYDTAQGKTQAEVNAGIQSIKFQSMSITTDENGKCSLTEMAGKNILRVRNTSGYITLLQYSTTVVVYNYKTMAPVPNITLTIGCYYYE